MMILMVMNTLFLVLLVLFIKVIPIRVYRHLRIPIRVYRYPKDFLKTPSSLIPFTSDTFISNKKGGARKDLYVYLYMSFLAPPRSMDFILKYPVFSITLSLLFTEQVFNTNKEYFSYHLLNVYPLSLYLSTPLEVPLGLCLSSVTITPPILDV